MTAYPEKECYDANDLAAIIALLRDPEAGCPWDKVQTHRSIRQNFLEETCEALEAIDNDDPVLMQEELGDVLMQVVFHSCIEQERGNFTFSDVCDAVCRKLIYRHPHIFARDAQQSRLNDWDALKNKEKGRRGLADELDTVPVTLPALMKAQKQQKRAARYGHAPDTAEAARAACEAAGREARAALDEQTAGRLLFTLAGWLRCSGIDAEKALDLYCKAYAAQARQDMENSAQAELPVTDIPTDTNDSRR